MLHVQPNGTIGRIGEEKRKQLFRTEPEDYHAVFDSDESSETETVPVDMLQPSHTSKVTYCRSLKYSTGSRLRSPNFKASEAPDLDSDFNLNDDSAERDPSKPNGKRRTTCIGISNETEQCKRQRKSSPKKEKAFDVRKAAIVTECLNSGKSVEEEEEEEEAAAKEEDDECEVETDGPDSLRDTAQRTALSCIPKLPLVRTLEDEAALEGTEEAQ